jgi:hypothetical protein
MSQPLMHVWGEGGAGRQRCPAAIRAQVRKIWTVFTWWEMLCRGPRKDVTAG